MIPIDPEDRPRAAVVIVIAWTLAAGLVYGLGCLVDRAWSALGLI